jgi:hypothetical protein
MKILIYGVGRSGTKAVQLYLSYLIASMEGKVWINYEPFFWLDRKTKAVNFEGFFQNMRSPHFAQHASEFSKGNIRFLKKLANHQESSVTKFIRGNGRINAIAEVFQADSTIIIIRDLYEVLLSVMKTEWDFWSVGWDYKLSWDDFIQEVRTKEIVDNLDWCLGKIEDRIDQNAFYWYTMNLSALKSDKGNNHWIDYRKIGEIENVARNILNVKELAEPFRSAKFSGENLHLNYPLQSHESSGFYSHIMNQILYKMQFFKKYGWFIPPKNIGSLAHINKDYFLVEEKNRGTSVVIEKKDLHEFFNEDIRSRLEKKISEKSVTPLISQTIS